MQRRRVIELAYGVLRNQKVEVDGHGHGRFLRAGSSTRPQMPAPRRRRFRATGGRTHLPTAGDGKERRPRSLIQRNGSASSVGSGGYQVASDPPPHTATTTNRG